MRMARLIDDHEFVQRRTALLAEAGDLRHQLQKLENANEWIEPLSSINYASTSLVFWFLRGSEKLRRKIFQLLGSNPTLTNKALSIDLEFPVLPMSIPSQLFNLSAQ
jgi:hypothetical protein